MTIKMTGLEEIQALLKIIQRNTTDTAPIMRGIAHILQRRIQNSFDSKKSPFGQPWKPSQYGLVHHGHLSQFSTSANAYSASVYNSVVYAAIHQFGGTIKPKNGKYLTFKGKNSRFVRVKQVVIPARPYLPINALGQLDPTTHDDIINTLKDIITDRKYR